MITDSFFDLGLAFIGWVLDLFGDAGPEITDAVGGFAVILAQVLSGAAGLGAWVPWLLIVGVVGTIFTLWGIFTLVKFVTWVKSLFWAGS